MSIFPFPEGTFSWPGSHLLATKCKEPSTDYQKLDRAYYESSQPRQSKPAGKSDIHDAGNLKRRYQADFSLIPTSAAKKHGREIFQCFSAIPVSSMEENLVGCPQRRSMTAGEVCPLPRFPRRTQGGVWVFELYNSMITWKCWLS